MNLQREDIILTEV